MKKLFASVAAVALFTFAGSALAEEASGTIQSVDPEGRMIQLDDGTSYTVSEDVAIETLQPGTEVTVSYEEQNGENVATEVVPSQ